MSESLFDDSPRADQLHWTVEEAARFKHFLMEHLENLLQMPLQPVGKNVKKHLERIVHEV